MTWNIWEKKGEKKYGIKNVKKEEVILKTWLEVLDNSAIDGIISGDFLILKEDLVNYCMEINHE